MSEGRQAEFYNSTEWKRCRESYKKSVGGLCEMCKARGKITPAKVVHHKIHLNAQNIDDVNLTLNFSNLMALCQDCHAEIHGKPKRYRVNADGSVEMV